MRFYEKQNTWNQCAGNAGGERKAFEKCRLLFAFSSEYLRRLGLGKDVKAATDEKIYKTFRLIRQLKKDFDLLERSEILHRLSVIEDLLK